MINIPHSFIPNFSLLVYNIIHIINTVGVVGILGST